MKRINIQHILWYIFLQRTLPYYSKVLYKIRDKYYVFKIKLHHYTIIDFINRIFPAGISIITQWYSIIDCFGRWKSLVTCLVYFKFSTTRAWICTRIWTNIYVASRLFSFIYLIAINIRIKLNVPITSNRAALLNNSGQTPTLE